MCRLLAWVAPQPLTVAEAVGESELAAFRRLSLQHSDGWGIAYHPAAGGSDIRTQHSTLAAARDPAFDAAVRGTSSDAGFAHLRWATPGLPVVEENTHPFLHDGWAFAHNGAIHPQGRLDELLSPRWLRRMRGTTDSERYFLAILARIDEGMSVRDAIATTVREIFTRFQPTGLNAMLLGADALYVVSAFDPVRAPVLEEAENRGVPPDAVSYDLHHRGGEHSYVVASSGLGQTSSAGWDHLPNMTLLRIERGTLRTAVDSLATDAVAGRG
ncbi:MAG: class II glutamine amidotransferase [Candidatus Dormibacteraeota bacterium]|nr:class II glutamine amidotransferase [Candidatus Dormibacteraeota bacterium]MBV9525382.1 class II glutamine amidotransferase [Candidatus Dormibacteraeota bacterium]